MAAYTDSQNQPPMSNRGVSRTPISPAQSQATTVVLPNPGRADDVNDPVTGWPVLSRIIAKNPELEAFPSFGDLMVKSLLYYQAELISLRKDLHQAEWADKRQVNSEDDCDHFAENLELLILARDDALESAALKDAKPILIVARDDDLKIVADKNEPIPMPRQWVLMEKIRTTLDKYSKLVRSIPRKLNR